MSSLKVIFGCRSHFIDYCLKLLPWSSYLLISNSDSKIYDENLNLLGSTEELSLLILNKLKFCDTELVIIYSGPFSRSHTTDSSSAIKSLHNLYILIDKVRIRFPSTIVRLKVLGSTEAFVSGFYDQYRQLKQIELDLFLLKLLEQDSQLKLQYYALPTMRPSRLAGRLISVTYQYAVQRFIQDLNNKNTGVGQFKNLKYLLLGWVLLKSKLNNRVGIFKW